MSAENVYDILNRDQLIEIIIGLKDKVIKMNEEYKKIIDLRLYHLERNQNMHM